MRHVARRGVVVVLSVFLAFGVLAAPRGERDFGEKQNPVMKVVKRLIRALGDGLIVPTP